MTNEPSLNLQTLGMTMFESHNGAFRLPSAHQFRMRRLQVLNWGTFSDLHSINISERGFLFTGRSGSGKSTLLDAIAALLMQPGRVEFNAAAREGEKSRRGDRSIASYMRGAYGEQTDTESGESTTQFLRGGTTRSALALSYANSNGDWVVLVQFMYIRGTTSNSADVKRLYMIFDEDFDLQELSGFDIDIRKIKQAFAGRAHINDEFRPHSERFRRMLGIENELALTLLHKTQSTKNLGDLNTFLRTFMLDEPETFNAANRLVNEFGELDQAHQSVLTAKNQIATLEPADEFNTLRKQCEEKKNELKKTQEHIEAVSDEFKARLLGERISELDLKIAQSQATRVQKESKRSELKVELQSYEKLHRELGGDAINGLENEKLTLERSKTSRLTKLSQAKAACDGLGWTIADTPADFTETVSKARNLLQESLERGDADEKESFNLNSRIEELTKLLAANKRELEGMRKKPTNIPHLMQEVRKRIAEGIKVNEDSLPFAGELIEVRDQDSQWRGAINRVLHGLALTLLVEDKHYNALLNYVNSTHLGARIVFVRTSNPQLREDRISTISSMANKLRVKGGVHAAWLDSEIRRVNLDCVDSVQALKNSEKPAVTKDGLLKTNRARHEKDDRHDVNDQRFWPLGFDNKERIAVFEKERDELTTKLDQLRLSFDRLRQEDKRRSANALHWQTLINLQWEEIDVLAVVERLDSIDEQLKLLRDKNSDLAKIDENIRTLTERAKKFDESIADLGADEREASKKLGVAKEELTTLQKAVDAMFIQPERRINICQRVEALGDHITLSNLDKCFAKVDKAFGTEIADSDKLLAECKQLIEKAFSDFKRQWALESANMDESLRSTDDYLQLLQRLKNDNLPKYEEKFFDLLRKQSNQNLAALNTHLNQARKTIHDRMEIVNVSLLRAYFNPGTYLQIQTSDLNLQEVKDFRQQVSTILNYAWADDREQAELRFTSLRDIVKKLSSAEWKDKTWKEKVLDVRLHVEFIGKEIDSTGREVEIYRSGAGKSGGQRQKLTTTCLAAALHYQLSRGENVAPTYSAVVLDEAFDKADHEFTAMAMKIFEEFGFQMIIATPIKSVMTLEAFIGGACYVDIKDRKESNFLLLEYDHDNSRLILSEELRRDVETATAIS